MRPRLTRLRRRQVQGEPLFRFDDSAGNVTYTLPEEGGASLRGAGFTCLGIAGGGTWDRRERPRVDLHPTQQKLRWERSA